MFGSPIHHFVQIQQKQKQPQQPQQQQPQQQQQQQQQPTTREGPLLGVARF